MSPSAAATQMFLSDMSEIAIGCVDLYHEKHLKKAILVKLYVCWSRIEREKDQWWSSVALDTRTVELECHAGSHSQISTDRLSLSLGTVSYNVERVHGPCPQDTTRSLEMSTTGDAGGYHTKLFGGNILA